MADLTLRESNTAVVAATSEEVSQYLTFLAEGERFGIGILDINEIIEVGALTHVPMAPRFIRGVINLRGSVVPVVDLAARLGRGEHSDLTKRSCIVIVEVTQPRGTQIVGMLVDEVDEILEIPATHLQRAPDFGGEGQSGFIGQMGRVDDEFIILLDIDHLLSLEELSLMDNIREAMGDATETEVTQAVG